MVQAENVLQRFHKIRGINHLATTDFSAVNSFRTARALCSLSVPEAAKLLRVSTRTVQYWESGAVGVPYTAYKLMRILRGYELPSSAWKGFRVVGDTMWSSEGLAFKAADLRWWSLTCRMAGEFRAMMAERYDLTTGERASASGLHGASSPPPNPASCPISGNLPPHRGVLTASASASLSPSSNHGVLEHGETLPPARPRPRRSAAVEVRHARHRGTSRVPAATRRRPGGAA